MSLSTTQYGYIVDPMVPFTDDKGKTIKNGFIRVFMAGTSTPVLTYRNYDGATNQEKIELDNSGRVKHNVIGSKGSLYKVVVYNILHSQENPLLTVDKIAVLGASINASGATIVTGLDSVTVQEENFLKATVDGTGVELALDPTEVTSEVSTISDAATSAPDYVVPLLDKTGTGDGKKISLANIFKFALDWISRLATTITSFASGDYFAVSNTTIGARKMAATTLLDLTARNALVNNAAPEFDPTRTSENAYKSGESVVYNGRTYTFRVDHYGAWSAAYVYPFSIFDYVNEIGRSVIFLTIVDYTNILSRLNDGEFGYNTSTNQIVEKKGDTYASRYATKSDLFFYQNHFYVYDGTGLILQNDIMSKVPFSKYKNGYITLNGGVGSVVELTPVSSGSFEYEIIDAKEGDVFFVSGSSGSAPRLWGFIDSENKLLSVANASITRTDERIVAPQNAVKLISNSGKNTPHVVKQQMFFQDFASMVTKRVEDVENLSATESQQISDLSDATRLCNIGIENGGIVYANGVNTPAANRCRTISYLYGTTKVSLKSGFQIYTVIFYDKDTKAYSRSAYVQSSSATITPAANEVFRLNFAKSDSSANIDSSELKNSLFIEETWAKVVDVDNRVKAIETKRQPLVIFDYDHDLKDVSSIVSQFTMSPVSGLYSQVISFFDGLVSSFGGYVSKVDAALQEGIYYPVEWGNNKLWMYKFASDNSDIYSDNNKKKKLFIVGGLHGNEMAAPVNLCIFASNLCNIVDSNYYKLRSSYDIYIIPVLNVTGSLANTRTNYNGVDLNRNFPSSHWILDGEGTETYSGPSAGSEFETQVIVSLTETIKPDMAIDHHNYSGGINAIYTEIYRNTQIQLAMQCGVDDAIAFSKGLPAYFGTGYHSALFGTSNSAPKITTGNALPHMAEWWFEQDVQFSAIVEISNTIGWQEGVPGYSLDWMGSNTFSVGEYCFRNQILHYAQWVLDNV